MQPQRSSLIILILLGLALSGCTLFDLNEEDRPLMPEEIKSLKAEADSLRRQGRILREVRVCRSIGTTDASSGVISSNR